MAPAILSDTQKAQAAAKKIYDDVTSATGPGAALSQVLIDCRLETAALVDFVGRVLPELLANAVGGGAGDPRLVSKHQSLLELTNDLADWAARSGQELAVEEDDGTEEEEEDTEPAQEGGEGEGTQQQGAGATAAAASSSTGATSSSAAPADGDPEASLGLLQRRCMELARLVFIEHAPWWWTLPRQFEVTEGFRGRGMYVVRLRFWAGVLGVQKSLIHSASDQPYKLMMEVMERQQANTPGLKGALQRLRAGDTRVEFSKLVDTKEVDTKARTAAGKEYKRDKKYMFPPALVEHLKAFNKEVGDGIEVAVQQEPWSARLQWAADGSNNLNVTIRERLQADQTATVIYEEPQQAVRGVVRRAFSGAVALRASPRGKRCAIVGLLDAWMKVFTASKRRKDTPAAKLSTDLEAVVAKSLLACSPFIIAPFFVLQGATSATFRGGTTGALQQHETRAIVAEHQPEAFKPSAGWETSWEKMVEQVWQESKRCLDKRTVWGWMLADKVRNQNVLPSGFNSAFCDPRTS